jgi:hypothetical protein
MKTLVPQGFSRSHLSLATCEYLPYSRQNSLNLATHQPQGCAGNFHSSLHCREKHGGPPNRLQSSARLDGRTTRHVDVAREHYNYLNELFGLTESCDSDPIGLNQVPALHVGFSERSRAYNQPGPFPVGWQDRLPERRRPGRPIGSQLVDFHLFNSQRSHRAGVAWSFPRENPVQAFRSRLAFVRPCTTRRSRSRFAALYICTVRLGYRPSTERALRRGALEI